jgi:hypothetical protein
MIHVVAASSFGSSHNRPSGFNGPSQFCYGKRFRIQKYSIHYSRLVHYQIVSKRGHDSTRNETAINGACHVLQ